MASRVDGAADGGNGRGEAGRRLVVHGQHGLDGARRVGLEGGLDSGRIDAAAPIGLHHLRDQAHGFRHGGPALAEIAAFQHKHGVARGEQVDERRFPRAMAGCSVEEQLARGLQNALQAHDGLVIDRDELGVVEIDGGPVHRPQHAVGVEV